MNDQSAHSADDLTRSDRDELVKVIRQRGRLAHANIGERQARLKAQTEAELSAKFTAEDETWRDLTSEARSTVERLDAELAERAAAMGLRPEFRPSISVYWSSRGENGDRFRRAELRKLAEARIDALGRAAKLDVDRQVADSVEALIVGGLSSAEARGRLEALPTAESLMVAPSVAELESMYDRDRRQLGR